MTTYYSNKADFEKGDNTGLFHSNINCVKDLLNDIEEVTTKVQSEGLAELYVQTGDASLGKEMPESTFVNSEHRALSMLESAKEVHKWVMQNIDGKLVQGVDDATVKLNEVNEGNNTYKSDNLTYAETYTYQVYSSNNGPVTQTGTRIKHYTLSDILNSPNSPIVAARDLYQNKLANAKAVLEEMKKGKSDTYNELSQLSDEDLVEVLFPTQIGEYEHMRSTHKEKYKEVYGALEITVKIVGAVALIAGTVMTFGAATPVTATGLVLLVGGTVLTVGDQAYEYTTGESISGRALTEAERNWAGVGALMTILTVGSAGYVTALARAGKTASATAQTVTRGINVTDATLEVAEAGHRIALGEDPLTVVGDLVAGEIVNVGIARTIGKINTPNGHSLETSYEGVDLPNNSHPDLPDLPNKPEVVATDSHADTGDFSRNDVQSEGGTEVPTTGTLSELPQQTSPVDTSSQPELSKGDTSPSDLELPEVSPVGTGSATSQTIHQTGATPDVSQSSPDIGLDPATTGASAVSAVPTRDLEVPEAGTVRPSGEGSSVPHVDPQRVETGEGSPARPFKEQMSPEDARRYDQWTKYAEAGLSPEDRVRVLEISEKAPKEEYQEGVSPEDILTLSKEDRPDPDEVYKPSYIEAHRRQFENGAAKFQKFQPSIDYQDGIVGGKDGTSFWLSKDHADIIEEIAKGDNRLYETLLGFDEGYLGDGPLYRLDVSPEVVSEKGISIPSGREGGANEWWRPGGRTYPGDMPEGVMEGISTKEGDHTWNTVN